MPSVSIMETKSITFVFLLYAFHLVLTFVKCEYESLNRACTMCSRKGLECGAEHKVLAREWKSQDTAGTSAKRIALVPVERAPETNLTDDDQNIEYIPRGPPTPTHETLCTHDGLYMQFYWHTSGIWFDLINDGITNEKHPLAVCAALRFGPHIASKPVRSAVLFYSSFRKEGKLSCLGLQYLGQFYKGAREAIDRESYVELLYACYAMCLFEMASTRIFSEDFAKHANGFLMSYQHLVGKGILTYEERNVMNAAYTMIVQAINFTNSRWHETENWYDFAQTCMQRLDSVTSRLINSTKTINPWNLQKRAWIPTSHQLFRSEDFVYQLCTLFNQLTITRREETKLAVVKWRDTVATIEECLATLWKIISQSVMLNLHPDSVRLSVLRDGVATLPGDRFTRHIVALYYIFRLQYLILAQEWSETTCNEAIETSLAICRLYISPHESTYPGSEVRFTVNRGLFFSGVVAVESQNIMGKAFFLTTCLINSESKY